MTAKTITPTDALLAARRKLFTAAIAYIDTDSQTAEEFTAEDALCLAARDYSAIATIVDAAAIGLASFDGMADVLTRITAPTIVLEPTP